MANKIIVVGSINVDIFNIKPKKKYKGAVCPRSELMDTFILPGGKGANQAAVSSWLGAKTYMLGVVGNDEMGSWVLGVLQSQGVDVSRVLKSKTKPTSIITIRDIKEKTRYFVSPGANTQLTKKYIDDNIDLIKKADLVLTQLETPLSVVKYLAKICNKLNIPIILNPDPKIKFDKKLFAQFQYITPNRNEMSKEEIDWMVQNTETKIIQTLGREGATWYKQDGTTKKYKAVKKKVFSTIGAGDTFSATLAYCLVNDMTLDKSIKQAIKNSSWSVGQLGAQKLPKK